MSRTEQLSAEVVDVCTGLTERLRQATQSSRTTVRLVDADGDLVLAAESLAPGVPSMATGPAVDPRLHETYVHLERTHELLIQEDCRVADVRPPPSLIEHYRVLAQMLAPVVLGEELRGTISVHLMDQTRTWSPESVAALDDARHQLEAVLAGRAAGAESG